MVLTVVLFIAFASQGEWSGATCSLAGTFCEHPWLLVVPVLVTLAWGLALMMADSE
jgi:hypothetical protein